MLHGGTAATTCVHSTAKDWTQSPMANCWATFFLEDRPNQKGFIKLTKSQGDREKAARPSGVPSAGKKPTLAVEKHRESRWS